MSAQYVLGIDMGTESARAGVVDADGRLKGGATAVWTTAYPRPGRAEQDPEEWWRCVVAAVRGALDKADVPAEAIAGVSVDATSATVVLMDAEGRHLRPAIMWMDVRATAEAEALSRTGDPALKYSGFGDVSAEFGAPKAMWLRNHEPDAFAAAHVVADCTDWLVHRLTGEWSMSLNHATAKYFYDGEAGGWPEGLYAGAGASDVLEKFPERILPIGTVVGGLRGTAAEELGLRAGTPVAEGAIDAHAGAIGLGVVEPGRLALITGSSHVMIGQSASPLHAPGLWGAYTDAIVPGQYTVEAGQASTGSVVAWFRRHLARAANERAAAEGRDVYDILNEEAAAVPIGSEGLVVLDHFQGNRSPHTDALSRGVFWGLSLGHTEGHLFRAILEGICFGTESIFRVMREHGFPPTSVVVSGGPAKSRLWMQMHADVSNLPIQLTDVTEGPLLGAAMLAAVGAGIHADLPAAARAMTRTVDVIEPDPAAHEAYQFHLEAYLDTYPAMRELMHRMARHTDQG